MYMQRYIVARSRKHCCLGNTTIRSLFIIFDVDVAINNIKVLCCQGNATTCSFCTVVEQQNISYC
jgi:hypothetical protein